MEAKLPGSAKHGFLQFPMQPLGELFYTLQLPFPSHLPALRNYKLSLVVGASRCIIRSLALWWLHYRE